MVNSLKILIIVFILSACSSFKEREFDDDDKLLFTDTYAIPSVSNQFENLLTATYFGTSTLLIDDGEQAILIDGFFSRPGLSELVFERIHQSKMAVLNKVLVDANMSNLLAVVAVHSHHDHALDSPCIAIEYDAILIGSPSTMKIGCKGTTSPKKQSIVSFKKTNKISTMIPVGNYKVTLIKAEHSSTSKIGEFLLGFNKPIKELIAPPSHVTKFKEDQSFSVLIEHAQANILIHASAGFEPGILKNTLQDKSIDWLFLGIANLSGNDDDFIQKYFDETIGATNASFIVPIHWDDFTRQPSPEPYVSLYPTRWLFGNFKKDIQLIENRINKANQNGIPTKMYLMNFADQVHLKKINTD
jgi:L-ascorbate metabolism protein UlaG (beta-lactamase superfamily)